jgi:hypothetical protein
LPGEAGFFEIVKRVAGDAVIALYPGTKMPTYLRIEVDGSYTVSAEPPPALGPEEWVEARSRRGCALGRRMTAPLARGW